MKLRTFLFSIAGLFVVTSLIAQDPIVIPGGAENGGQLETIINGDTTATGERNNPNQVYELVAGSFYLQHSAINIKNPGGTLTIRGQEGGPKPVIVKLPLNQLEIGTNQINSSLAFQNIQYHNMQTDGFSPWNAFNITGDNHTLLLEAVMIEHCSGSLFDMNSVQVGCKATIRDSYFRDLHNGQQWWAGRVLDCRVPMDTLIIENNTFTGAGLTVLAMNCLIDYAVINHNTFINNTKYPFLNQYWKTLYMTNNLFVNANWVGEDYENVAGSGGQDPDALLHGLVGVDTITSDILIQDKYLNDSPSGLTEELDEISDYIWYAADNVCVASSTLDAYYGGNPNDGIDGAPASYLEWMGLGSGPWRVESVPGIFMNERTEVLIADWDNIKAENNSVYEMSAEELGFGTDPLPQAAADVYVDWNRSKWGVPGVAHPDIQLTRFGDYDPITIPGVETENSSAGGITKISDMIEDFSYSASLVSQSDGLPIGALHWDDIYFDSEASLASVINAYETVCTAPSTWTANPADYAFNGQINAKVYLDDIPVESGLLAAFVGDECRGIVESTYFEPADHFIFAMLCYSNEASGEILTFKYFDNSTCEVYEPFNESVEFNSDMIIQNAINPFELHYQADVQFIEGLVTGWNWFSVNVVADDMSLGNLLTCSTDGDYIKSQTKSSQYYEDYGWFGDLDSLNATELYKTKAMSACEVNYMGVPAVLSPIPIVSGWNWIGYLPQGQQAIDEALGSLTLEQNDYIKNQAESSTYYNDFGWYGNLEEMRPTEGYMIKKLTADELIYSEAPSASVSQASKPEGKTAISAELLSTSFSPHEFEFSGQVTAKVFVDGALDGSKDNLLLAYVDGEFRGASKGIWFEPAGAYAYPIMIYSNVAEGELISFKYQDTEKGQLNDCEEMLPFHQDMVEADAFESFELHVNSTLDAESPSVLDELSLTVYPNPFENVLHIEYTLDERSKARLIVYDMLGKLVEILNERTANPGTSSLEWDATNLPKGTYILKLTTNDQMLMKRVVLIR